MRGVRPLYQAESDDCGLASLAMIANYHGYRIDLTWLKERSRHCNFGPSLQTILASAALLRLDARPLRADVQELGKLILPAILHWKFNHFIVVTRVGKRRIQICDPAVGRRNVSIADVARSFTGVAVEFVRLPSFSATRSSRRLRISHLLNSFTGLSRYLMAMLVLLFAAQLLGLALPVATQLLIDEVVLGQDKRWLNRVIAGIGLVMLAMILIDTLRRRFALFTGVRMSVDSASALVRHVFSLSVSKIEKRTVADLMSRIDSLLPIQGVMTESLLNAVVQCVTLSMTLLLMLFYSPLLTAISVTALLLVVITQAAILPRLRARNLDAVIATAEAKQSLIESLRAFGSISAFGIGGNRLAHWRNAYLRVSNARAEQGKLAIIGAAGQSVIGAADQMTFLLLGVAGVASKSLSLGALFALLGLRGRLNAAVSALIAVSHDIYLSRSHLDRVGELLIELPEPDVPESALRAPLRGAIGCKGLSYHYPGAANIIAAFSCEISVGERVVVCGPSGVGKSTLLRLLYAELTPDQGSITYDGMDADLWDRPFLKSQFGIVRQGDRLLMGSIADNITCFSSSPTLPHIRRVATQACIWDDILALPMKLQTPLNSTGTGLSGGQIQRLLIARALYRAPNVLFLDEATSHLDLRTETRVLKNLASTGATIISVAHGENAVCLGGRPLNLTWPSRGN